MNATKFVVFLFLIGVVCSNVGARQLEEVSKKTKLGISIPKTATTNGLGSELRVSTSTSSYHSEYATAVADTGPGGPSASGTGSSYGSSSGSVDADGPNANASSSSGSYGQSSADVAAGPDGANSSGSGYGSSSTYASGSTGSP